MDDCDVYAEVGKLVFLLVVGGIRGPGRGQVEGRYLVTYYIWISSTRNSWDTSQRVARWISDSYTYACISFCRRPLAGR